MRFQNPEKQPEFGGRDRKIVLLFLGALAIFFVVHLASKPEFRRAFSADEAAPESSTAGGDPAALRDDEFLVGSDADTPAIASGVSTIPTATPEDAAGARYTIDSAHLRAVRDNTVGIWPGEQAAYYATLERARRLPEVAPSQAKAVPYTVLMAEPQAHRGELITVTGKLRRLTRMRASENQFGIAQLYDAWVFTRESGSNPIHIVCAAVPDRLRPAMSYDDPPEVTLAGYFFKTQGYAAAGTAGQESPAVNAAPLVLASSLSLVPVVGTQTRDLAADMIPWLWWFSAAVAVVLIIVLWNFAASDWSFRHTRAHSLVHADSRPDFESVDAVPTTEMLRQLSK